MYDEALKFAGQNRSKIIVTTNGVFDILTVAHVAYLKKARALGDILIVLLNSDSSVKRLKGDKRPINNMADRKMVLESLRFIDKVFIFNEDDPRKILEEIQPNIHVKGGDYNITQIIERKVVEANKGRVVLLDKIEGVSTTNIINEIVKRYGK